MNDFDKRFNKMQDDFDKDFNRMKKLAPIVFVINLLIILATISFVVWVVVKLLQFWGVI